MFIFTSRWTDEIPNVWVLPSDTSIGHDRLAADGSATSTPSRYSRYPSALTGEFSGASQARIVCARATTTDVDRTASSTKQIFPRAPPTFNSSPPYGSFESRRHTLPDPVTVPRAHT